MSPVPPFTVLSQAAESLLGQLADDVQSARRRGESVDLEALAGQYPELADVIRQVFPVLGALGEPQPTADPLAGAESLGDFRLLRELGRGGMGIVYEAEQRSLGRRVALKILPLAAMLDERQLRRFRNEAHAAAVLKHPHIVSVYAVGCERGVHFYAMELIEGCSLADVLRPVEAARSVGSAADLPLPPRGGRHEGPRDPSGGDGWSVQRTLPESVSTVRLAAASTLLSRDPRSRARAVAQLGLTIAESLAYAHREGIIHRDIKPANLLLDRAGKLWITDFGLARVGTTGDLTMTGDVLGTLRYMSPEQLRGDTVVDERTDVYSLGLTLYEALVGRPAFGAGSRETLVRLVLESDPPPPRKLASQLPADLETIVLRAIDKDRDRRYSSAGELADDLRRFLEHRPIKARRTGPLRRLLRAVQRNPVVTGVAFALFLSLILGTMISSWQWSKARQRAQELARSLYRSDMYVAMQAWNDGRVADVDEIVSRYVPAPGDDDRRGWEWYYLWRSLGDSQSWRTLRPDQPATGLAFSSDGATLFAYSSGGFAAFDLQTGGRLDERTDVESAVVRRATRGVRAHPNGPEFARVLRQLILANGGKSVSLGELNNALSEVPSDDGMAAPYSDYSADGQLLALVHWGAGPTVWDLQTGERLHQISLDRGPFLCVAISPDGRWVLAGGEGRQVELMDARTGADRHIVQRHGGRVAAVAFSADGTQAASAGENERVVVWELESGRILGTFPIPAQQIYELEFSRDGKLLAGAEYGGRVVVWDLRTGGLLRRYAGHRQEVRAIAFSPDGRRLASAGLEGEIQIRDLTAEADRDMMTGHQEEARSLALVPNSTKLVSASWDSTIRIWDTESRACLRVLRGHTSHVLSVDTSLDGRSIASGGLDGTLRVWDAETGRLRAELRDDEAPGPFQSVAFGPNPQLVATFGQGTEVAIRDVDQRSILRRMRRAWTDGDGYITRGNWSPNGRALAAGTSTGNVFVWDAASGNPVARLDGHKSEVWSVAFSPDSRLVATGGADQLIRIWEHGEGHLMHTLRGHANYVIGLAFSPDGRTLASASMDGTVRLWDVVEGYQRAVLQGHTAGASSVVFSEDGSTLYSGDQSGVIRIWRAATPAQADRALARESLAGSR